MVVSLEENLRFRISRDLKERWTRACEERKISQQDAINALVEFFVDRDELVQLMILGQVSRSADLVRLALRSDARLMSGEELTNRRQAASQSDAARAKVEEKHRRG